MKLCKEILPDGKPCPNQVDDRQEYCFFHLANRDAKAKNILSIVFGAVLGVVALVLKSVGSSKSE